MQRRLGATITGHGERTIVFANGLGTSQATWRHITSALMSRARMVRFDNVCSPAAPPGGYRAECYASLYPYVDDALALIDELALDDVLFVGHSISGIIGLLAAVAAPERIRRVATICSTPRFLADANYPVGLATDVIDGILHAAQDDYPAWATAFASQAIGPDASEAERLEFCTLLAAMRPDIAMRTLRTVFLSDFRDILGRVSQPVMVMHSQSDAAVPLEAGEYLVQHLPNATLVPLQARGHVPHLTAPRQVVQALEQVLDQWT